MDEPRSATASDQVNTKVWREAQYAMMSLPRTRYRLRSKALSAAFTCAAAVAWLSMGLMPLAVVVVSLWQRL